MDVVRERLATLEDWYKTGGVLLISYTMFAMLVEGKNVKPVKLLERFHECLCSPGADLVVCDEGHMLKNDKSNLSKAVSQIETRRRIVLTGTPMQNNLVEYHCMVSFVKPNLLGSIKEFKNRFVNPIAAGQNKDSTESDVRVMKKRAHVLHIMLEGCVQRKDYAVIKNDLMPKREYVLSVRLSDKQIELYRAYLGSRGIENIANLGRVMGAQLFVDFQNLSRVWTHPYVLKLHEVREIRNEERKAQADFLADNEEKDDDEDASSSDKTSVAALSDEVSSAGDERDEIVELNGGENLAVDNGQFKYRTRRSTVNGGGINRSCSEPELKLAKERWWSSVFSRDADFDMSMGGKLIILDKILKICKQKREKLLIFSQSLLSLDIIEQHLKYQNQTRQETWSRNLDYFRLDGSTDREKRTDTVDRFNNANDRARLFLISTKAGGIGINLVGANRCVIFDACWNPAHDTQSIFRIYRFGQTRPVYVYRLLAQGTMEEKIYQRQVTKQGLSQRVVDEHQLDRHFTSQELRELYSFEPDTLDESQRPTLSLPDDDLLRSVIAECKKWVVKYHEHDSLLENKLDEGLSEAERKAAWTEYELEKNNQEQRNAMLASNGIPGIFQPDPNEEALIQNFANEYRERIMADLFANTINQQQTQHQIQAHQRRQYANHQLHQYAPDPDIYMENSVAANQQQRQQGMPNRGLSKASTTNSLLSSIQNMRNAGQAQRNPIMNEILASSSNLASVVEANEAMRRSHRQPPQNQLRQSDYIPNLPVTQLAQYHRNQVLAQTFNNQQQPQTINRLPITRVSSALSQQQRSSTPNKQ